MSTINIHNYEAYLLDYAEGNLSDKDQVDLEIFLFNNPQIDISLNDLKLVHLEIDNSCFLNKQSIKKSERDLVSEELFVSYIENQLSGKEKINFEKSCRINNRLANELKLYKNTILSPDLEIVFPNKNRLKRQSKLVLIFAHKESYVATAASVLFLMGLFLFWRTFILLPNSVENNSDYISLKDETVGRHVKVKQTEIKALNKKTNSIKINSKKVFTTQTTSSVNKVQMTNVISQASNEMIQITKTKPDSLIEKIDLTDVTAIEKNQESERNNIATVEIQTEYESSLPPTEQSKKSILGKFGNLLRKLHQAGLNPVNGNQESVNDMTQYSLTLGNIKIKHKTAAKNL